jgi:hypothetical protein
MAARAWKALLMGGALIGSAALADPVTPPPTPADYAALAKLPDWSGTWQPDWSQLFSSREADKPSLTPTAAAALAKFDAEKAKGEHQQTDAANCVPPGMPQIMRMPYPIEFIYSPGRVTIAAETYSQVRRVYTDGRPLPDDPDPAFNGHSIGHWEGDTLVVETNGLNPQTSIVAGVHPTAKTRIRETFHLDKPDVMRVDTIITDPDVFAKPFELKQAYVRKRDWEIREYVCQENNHDASDEFGRPSMKLD